MATPKQAKVPDKNAAAAEVLPAVPMAESFQTNGGLNTNLNYADRPHAGDGMIGREFTRADWTNICGGLAIAAGQAHLAGNAEQMFGYMRYTNAIGQRLGAWGQATTTGVSDSSPPLKAQAAGA